MDRVKSLLKSEKPLKWLFYGDSITHGAVHTKAYRDYTQHFSEALRRKKERQMDLILNSAISGNTTKNLLESFDWRARQFSPNAVFLMIGMNDCSEKRADRILPDEFEKNLNILADNFAAMGAMVIFQTTCPILPGGAPEREPHLPRYMELLKRVAAMRGLPLIDHYSYWIANKDSHRTWMANAFHPNGHGHAAFANYIFKHLDIPDRISLD